MISAGIGGPITGEGADLLIIDDPIKNRKEADSKTYRDMVWDEWQNTLYTRLRPDGAVIIILTRWHEDDLIIQGLVEVNGKVVTEMGYQVQKTDRVVFDGQGITPEKPVYVLLNKPKGYISTTKDEKARKTVMELVANASPYRVFPVGRLDRSTTGVILLTNDGHLTKKLTHPSFNMKKIYHVTLDRKLDRADLNTILEGVRLEEGVAEVDSISYIDGKPKNEVGIEIHIGWNRVVRRIFQKLGYEVEALDRVMFAGLTKKNIKRGHWRILTELEVNNLKML